MKMAFVQTHFDSFLPGIDERKPRFREMFDQHNSSRSTMNNLSEVVNVNTHTHVVELVYHRYVISTEGNTEHSTDQRISRGKEDRRQTLGLVRCASIIACECELSGHHSQHQQK